MIDDPDKRANAIAARIEAEITDSFDEELEMEIDDERLHRLLDGKDRDSDAGLLDRQLYFKELFRLQRELVKLQDWIVHHQGSRSSSSLKAATRPARAA